MLYGLAVGWEGSSHLCVHTHTHTHTAMRLCTYISGRSTCARARDRDRSIVGRKTAGRFAEGDIKRKKRHAGENRRKQLGKEAERERGRNAVNLRSRDEIKKTSIKENAEEDPA